MIKVSPATFEHGKADPVGRQPGPAGPTGRPALRRAGRPGGWCR
jgi:hypothetical protein